MRALDLSGRNFSRLTAIRRAGGGNRIHWECRCACGAIIVVASDKLVSGHTGSCGCLLADKNRARLMTHGNSRKAGRSLTYKTYTNMVTRCENENAINFDQYGGAGITICDRWRKGDGDVSGFECFLADLGPRPSRRHSIDRIDADAGYFPGNCRWATASQQMLNRNMTVKVRRAGKLIPLIVACELDGVKYATAWARLARGKAWNEGRRL